MKKTVMFISSALFSSMIHAAALYSLNKTQVQQTFINKTLLSIGVDNLNCKTVNNSNSVFLDGHGIVYGKMGHQPKNQPQYDKGTYKIADNGTIYIKWNQWDDSKKLCFHVFEAKNAYITIDCQGLYHSTFMKSDIKTGNKLLH